MAECFKCGQDMNEASGCDDNRTITFADGEEVEPIPHGEEDRERTYQIDNRDCHDCGAEIGEYHHPGCDSEECPRCGGQYFICDCVTDEKNEVWASEN